MPAIAKILLVFVAMLAVTRVRVPLGIALVAGGVALNLWAGVAPAATAANLGYALVNSELWLLLGIMGLIIEIGRYMTVPRNASELVAAASRWGGRHGRTWTLMALPAVVGLVPMPAGALFSAPFVEQAGSGINGRPDWKTAVNYWFRHIWEYWWPLYPGVIVAMSVFEMGPAEFIATQFFYTPVAVAAGFFSLIRPHVAELAANPPPDQGTNRRALRILLPILLVLTALFVFPAPLLRVLPSWQEQTRKMFAVLLGLLVGVGLIVADVRQMARAEGKTPRGLCGVFSSLFSPSSRNVFASLAGVLVFKFMLKTSNLLPLAGEDLVRSGVPLWTAAAALPFLAGLVAGVAVGFTGLSFPLVAGLMAAAGPESMPKHATLVLAYGFGYMGMMLSPVHLCLLVSRDYFASTIVATLRRIAFCVVAILVACLAGYGLLRAVGW